MRSKFLLPLMILLSFCFSTAQAACMPPMSFKNIVAESNTKGDWIGYWCSPNTYYIAACVKSTCSLVGSKRAVADWISNPSLEKLTFGSDPITDPKLIAVWKPSFAKMEAIRPKQ